MNYIRAIVKERPTINNSEIRIRYPGNQTGSHMGGPVSPKHRYYYSDQGIDCMMVRMVYFVHDVNRARASSASCPPPTRAICIRHTKAEVPTQNRA